MIIFCADHGDFLGDHWLGEKELFYDTVQRVPFIVVDPRPEADATRGSEDDRFVECVDVVPTVLDALGPPIPRHRIEGESLLPLLLHGQQPAWRQAVYSELDYSFREARLQLGCSPQQSRASRCARRSGATSTGWTCPKNSMTCRPTPSSSATSAASPRQKACGARCASNCSTSWPGASTARR